MWVLGTQALECMRRELDWELNRPELRSALHYGMLASQAESQPPSQGFCYLLRYICLVYLIYQSYEIDFFNCLHLIDKETEELSNFLQRVNGVYLWFIVCLIDLVIQIFAKFLA